MTEDQSNYFVHLIYCDVFESSILINFYMSDDDRYFINSTHVLGEKDLIYHTNVVSPKVCLTFYLQYVVHLTLKPFLRQTNFKESESEDYYVHFSTICYVLMTNTDNVYYSSNFRNYFHFGYNFFNYYRCVCTYTDSLYLRSSFTRIDDNIHFLSHTPVNDPFGQKISTIF